MLEKIDQAHPSKEQGCFLSIIGSDRTYQLAPQEKYTLGSLPSMRQKPDCIPIMEPGVSKIHAFIEKVQNQWMFTDCSTNGSQINGRRVHHSKVALHHADVIQIGETRFYFQNPQVVFDDAVFQTKKISVLPKSAKETPSHSPPSGSWKNQGCFVLALLLFSLPVALLYFLLKVMIEWG